MASGKRSFREHCATKWLLEANPRNISASKISRYTVIIVHVVPALELMHALPAKCQLPHILLRAPVCPGVGVNSGEGDVVQLMCQRSLKRPGHM